MSVDERLRKLQRQVEQGVPGALYEYNRLRVMSSLVSDAEYIDIYHRASPPNPDPEFADPESVPLLIGFFMRSLGIPIYGERDVITPLEGDWSPLGATSISEVTREPYLAFNVRPAEAQSKMLYRLAYLGANAFIADVLEKPDIYFATDDPSSLEHKILHAVYSTDRLPEMDKNVIEALKQYLYFGGTSNYTNKIRRHAARIIARSGFLEDFSDLRLFVENERREGRHQGAVVELVRGLGDGAANYRDDSEILEQYIDFIIWIGLTSEQDFVTEAAAVQVAKVLADERAFPLLEQLLNKFNEEEGYNRYRSEIQQVVWDLRYRIANGYWNPVKAWRYER